MELRECAPDDVQLRDELLSRDSGLRKKQTLIIYFKNCKDLGLLEEVITE